MPTKTVHRSELPEDVGKRTAHRGSVSGDDGSPRSGDVAEPAMADSGAVRSRKERRDGHNRLEAVQQGHPVETEVHEEGNFPDKHFTMPGKGPDGLTIKTFDRETAIAYLGLED